jgi:hypothetical protein
MGILVGKSSRQLVAPSEAQCVGPQARHEGSIERSCGADAPAHVWKPGGNECSGTQEEQRGLIILSNNLNDGLSWFGPIYSLHIDFRLQ